MDELPRLQSAADALVPPLAGKAEHWNGQILDGLAQAIAFPYHRLRTSTPDEDSAASRRSVGAIVARRRERWQARLRPVGLCQRFGEAPTAVDPDQMPNGFRGWLSRRLTNRRDGESMTTMDGQRAARPQPGACAQHRGLHRLLRGLDDLRDHRRRDQGGARADRDQFGLLVATPVLTGSLTRLMLGIWAEQFGGRMVFTAQMLLTAIATWLLTHADSYPTFLLAALGVGLAGGSFAIGVAYVSHWFPGRSRARRSASSAPATSAPRSPSSSPRWSWSPRLGGGGAGLGDRAAR